MAVSLFIFICLKIADEFVKTAVGDNGRVGDQQVVPRFAVMLPLKPGGDFAPVDGCFFFGRNETLGAGFYERDGHLRMETVRGYIGRRPWNR